MAEYHREIDNCIAALHTMRMATDYYASGPGLGTVAEEVVKMLGGVENKEHYSFVPLRMAMARLVHQTYIGPLPTDLGDQPRPSET